MNVSLLAVGGYRSLQNLVLPLAPLTVISGANGSGKSNLYRALRLLVAAARRDLEGELAREGGLPAVLWAGPEQISPAMRRGEQPIQGGARREPVRLRLGFAADPMSYALEVGYPPLDRSAFTLDPKVKDEWIWAGGSFHPRALLARGAGSLSGDAEPEHQAIAAALREQILSWRFYDNVRTDRDAPARHPGMATRCEALSDDGRDLPAAVQTIREVGDWSGFSAAIRDAFPGCELGVETTHPVFRLQLRQPGLLRPLEAAELSDGTLRYLLLAAALFSPRLPPLLVLNEPENSLHPELLAPLARMINAAAQRTQVWVIAHAPDLVQTLTEKENACHHKLEREHGATVLPGQTRIDRAAWRWPA
ncbi:MAG: AAA family ATPase [Cyanobacteriota bacterium]|nr:AAA family ATPase [Cyanobacteriota bacterium]